VSVEPTYLETRSSPDSSQYFWAYRVIIENQGRETVQSSAVTLNPAIKIGLRRDCFTVPQGAFASCAFRCGSDARFTESYRYCPFLSVPLDFQDFPRMPRQGRGVLGISTGRKTGKCPSWRLFGQVVDDLCRDSPTFSRNLLKISAADGFFQCPETPMVTVIRPLTSAQTAGISLSQMEVAILHKSRINHLREARLMS